MRRKKGVSQEELAKALGCTQAHVAQVERSPAMRPQTLEKFADALGIPPEEILRRARWHGHSHSLIKGRKL